MKKLFLLIIFLLLNSITSFIWCQNAQLPIIKDVRGEIFDDSAQIIVEANCDLQCIDYTLDNPPRLIIDPIGKVYSDLREEITFDSGPVRKVVVIKGKAEEGLTGNFYPLDFISIELAGPPEYKVSKRVKEEVIVDIAQKKEIPPPPKIIPKEEMEEVVEELPKEEVVEEAVVPLPEIKIQKIETQVPPSPTAEMQEPIPLEPQKKEEVPVIIEPAKFVYKIGEGDTLDISVWQHPELDRRVIVRPDGFISFPLVGDIKAVGLTPPQLTSNIRENLSRLIRDPQVTIIVSGFGSKNIFVLGEVAKAGAYPFRGGMTILDAISECGGWKNSAVLTSVILVRKVFTDQPEAYRLDVYAIIKKGDFTQNYTLEPGDVIYVPKSFVANIGGFIENLRVSIGAYITESTKVFD